MNDVKSNPSGIKMIVPLADRVVVRREGVERLSEGGIVIPDTACEKPVRGEVLAVGRKVKELAVGDCVLFGKYAGIEVQLSEEVLVMREEDVFCILEA